MLPTQQGTQPPTAKDTRRPWARLMEYRLDIADWDAARMARCDNAWLELDEAPVLLRAQAPPEDEKEKAEAQKKKTSPPPEPMGQAEKLKARVEARGPSRLRYEVRQADDASGANVAHHHQNCRADALSMTASGAARLAGQPRAGIYGARRSPTMAIPRAQMAPPRTTPTNEARADDTAHRALDIDEEPSRMARPTVRALATRLFTAPHSVQPQVVPAAPKISGPILLNCGHPGVKRKRGRADEADAAAAAPPTKRRTRNATTHARSMPGSQSAGSGARVGRHVQRRNDLLPPPGSRAPSGTPGGTKPGSIWRRRAAKAWAATVHALASVVTAKLPATMN